MLNSVGLSFVCYPLRKLRHVSIKKIHVVKRQLEKKTNKLLKINAVFSICMILLVQTTLCSMNYIFNLLEIVSFLKVIHSKKERNYFDPSLKDVNFQR